MKTGNGHLAAGNRRDLRIACLALCAVVFFALYPSAGAQQPKKPPLVGFLIASVTSSQESRLEAFKRGLRVFGYIDGQNIFIEVRSGEGKPDRLAAAANELVQLKVDVIVTGGPTSTVAANVATSTIPIMTTLEGDPVGDGLVASLARPAGNITGLSSLSADLSGKRLEILKETVPKVSGRDIHVDSSARRYC